MRPLVAITAVCILLTTSGGCGDSKPDNKAIETPPGQRLDPPTVGGTPKNAGATRPKFSGS